MQPELMNQLANAVLLPLLPGSRLEPPRISTRLEKNAAFLDPNRIAFKTANSDTHRLILQRPQEFDQISQSAVTELSIVQAFVKLAKEMESGLSSNYRDEVMSGFQRRVVARALVPENDLRYHAVLEILDVLDRWAATSYEGGRISAAIGVDWEATGTGPVLSDMQSHDFTAVLTNGFDTLLTFDEGLRLINHLCVERPAATTESRFAPYRTAGLASWGTDQRLVFALNRLGEVLVYGKKKLLFAKRSGHWFFLTHSPALAQMRHPHDRSLRECVYASALDASFARTGACIGAVSNSNQSKWKTVVNVDDRLEESKTTRARAINAMIEGKTFQELDRRLRQELLAIDGATLIDHRGRILAVGAIISIDGGSKSGGRRAAAVKLGKFGVGVKVSQDGAISGFQGDEDAAFSVM